MNFPYFLYNLDIVFLHGYCITCTYVYTIIRYSLAPVFDGIPPEIMDQFRSYDIDADGSIDPYEFIGIAGDLEMDTAPDNSGRFNEVHSIQTCNVLIYLLCTCT